MACSRWLLLAVLALTLKTVVDATADQTCPSGKESCQAAIAKESMLLQLTRGSVASTSGCSDQPDQACPYYKSMGYCSYENVKQSCPQSCGACSSDCRDQPDQACAYYKGAGYCSYENIKKACPQSCGACSGGSPPRRRQNAPPRRRRAASGSCKALSANAAKQSALNVVFVPSAFRGDMNRFRQKVGAIYGAFGRYEPFNAAAINGLNVWYVDQESSQDNANLCAFGCYNTPRLLCCDGRQYLIDHARRNCGSGFVMSVLIVHNDDTYGGAGYPADGAATVSTNPSSPSIGVHELGHSLFGLADEYTYGSGNPSEDPNCDNRGCSKWSDLVQAGMASCTAGRCRQGGYYSDGTNMMKEFTVQSFGSVNQRIACCKYYKHTRAWPGYCSKFMNVGVGLPQYCNSQLWRGRYANLLQLENTQTAPNSTSYMLEMAEDTQGDQYEFVEKPVEWILSKDGETGDWKCMESPEVLQGGLYLRGHVIGDYNDTSLSGRHHRRSGPGGFVEVEVTVGSSGEVDRKLFFETNVFVEVPFDHEGSNSGMMDSMVEARSVIEIILREGEACRRPKEV